MFSLFKIRHFISKQSNLLNLKKCDWYGIALLNAERVGMEVSSTEIMFQSVEIIDDSFECEEWY